jgi:hypothetical protein
MVLAVVGLEETRSFLAREGSFVILFLGKRRNELSTSYKKGGLIISIHAYPFSFSFSFLFSALTGEFIGV